MRYAYRQDPANREGGVSTKLLPQKRPRWGVRGLYGTRVYSLSVTRTSMSETCTATERHDSCRMWSLGHPLVVCRAYVVTRQEFGSRCSDISRARATRAQGATARTTLDGSSLHQSRAHNLEIVSSDTRTLPTQVEVIRLDSS